MEQHPIPQHISSYQFRLVGDMTLKQFFQVAGGALTSLLFYAAPLHPLIKWPAILFFFGLGAALAFLPFEERPLEIWIVSFFRSIYSPTLFSWKRTYSPPKFFADEGKATLPTEKIVAPGGEAALKEYLEGTPQQKEGFLKKLEEGEMSFLAKITGVFAPNQTPLPAQEAVPVKETPKPQTLPLQVPAMIPTAINRPRIVVEEKSVFQAPVKTATIQDVGPAFAPTAAFANVSAQFSPDAAPPSPTTIPNTIVGQTLDSQGKIIESVIMEIRDSGGRPVRALRSNRLGHFMIVTPLANGRYEIISEKEGLQFEPIFFEAKGEIIQPIAIRSKNSLAGAVS